MSDKSLPKPVLPKDSTPQNSGSSQMPPSARIQSQAPVKSSMPPSPSSFPSTNKSQPTSPSVGTPPAGMSGGISSPPAGMKPPTGMKPPMGMKPPTGMNPPAGMNKPPLFTGKPTPPPASDSKVAAAAGSTSTSTTTPSSTKDGQGKSKPAFANVKNSPFKYLPFAIGGLVLIGIVWFIIGKFAGGKTETAVPTTPTTTPSEVRKTVRPVEEFKLIYWGLWEPDSTITDILKEYIADHPGLQIEYEQKSHKDYRERLQTAIAAEDGPDIFRYHASWTPMLAEELSPLPQGIMSAARYQESFYPVAAKMLSLDGQILGIPLMYDGLGLYYNKEMLTAANAEPPSTWAEVKVLASKLTVRDGSNLKRGGMAIGNASNVEHFADILGLLMLQNGADLSDPSSKEAQDALAFYTNFIKEDKVWDDKLPSSTVAFARGDAAMMLAPSWRAHEVMAINPNLEFGIVPVPRLGDDRLAWASFWAEGVSAKTGHPWEAWELLKFLSSKEIQKRLYSSQKQVRSFGEIYSRVDLANDLAEDELVSPFLEDAPMAKGWYLSSYTHDNGINDLQIKYYEDAINVVLSGESVEDALDTVAQGIKLTLRQYGVK